MYDGWILLVQIIQTVCDVQKNGALCKLGYVFVILDKFRQRNGQMLHHERDRVFAEGDADELHDIWVSQLSHSNTFFRKLIQEIGLFFVRGFEKRRVQLFPCAPNPVDVQQHDFCVRSMPKYFTYLLHRFRFDLQFV